MFLVLDTMIERALIPLADTSPSFLEMAAEIVAHKTIHRRRVSTEVQTACFAAFFGSRTQACHDLVVANPDRGFLFHYLKCVDSLGSKLVVGHTHLLKRKFSRVRRSSLQDLNDASRILGRGNRIVPAVQTSRTWYLYALDFRDQIVEKYIRKIYQSALREHKKAARRLEIPDLFATGYLVAIRAVEKFNSNSGVFTSYVSLWLRGVAYNISVQSIGVSFNTKSKKPSDVGWSVPLDDIPQMVDDSAATPHAEDGSSLVRKISAIAHDSDVRAALAVSGVVPGSDAVFPVE